MLEKKFVVDVSMLRNGLLWPAAVNSGYFYPDNESTLLFEELCRQIEANRGYYSCLHESGYPNRLIGAFGGYKKDGMIVIPLHFVLNVAELKNLNPIKLIFPDLLKKLISKSGRERTLEIWISKTGRKTNNDEFMSQHCERRTEEQGSMIIRHTFIIANFERIFCK